MYFEHNQVSDQLADIRDQIDVVISQMDKLIKMLNKRFEDEEDDCD